MSNLPLRVVDPDTQEEHVFNEQTGQYELAAGKPETATNKLFAQPIELMDARQETKQRDIKPVPDLQGVTGDTNASLVQLQIARMDGDRIAVAAALVNVFNHAIQVQAGRNDWTADDYAAFVIAMRAVDGIGARAIDEKIKG